MYYFESKAPAEPVISVCYGAGFNPETVKIPSFLDIKALNDEIAVTRNRLRALIRLCRMETTYPDITRKQRLFDLWQDYRALRKECHRLTSIYLNSLENRLYPSSHLPTPRRKYRAAA